jgi:murein tripeptide amidase MpaA
MMPPYRTQHLERLLDDIADHSAVSVRNLWTSESGESGKLVTLSETTDPRFHVWITARTHAFESVSSWVAEGMIRWTVSRDPDAEWLRENVSLNVVPIVDVDSVKIGGSGKHREPICHARDFRKKPH